MVENSINNSSRITDSVHMEIFEKIYSRILHFISHKPRSEKEVSDKIDSYNSDYTISSEDFSNIKEEVIADLMEKRYIRDLDYAEDFVRGAINSRKSRSKMKIKQFLYKKGVSRDVVTNALSLMPPNYDYENALSEGKKKLRMVFGADKFTKKAKLHNYLYQRGYSSSTISRVVDTLL